MAKHKAIVNLNISQNVEIIPVVNGFIVRPSICAFEEKSIHAIREMYVFNTSIELGQWLADNMITQSQVKQESK
jgi:hypothetical protein